MVYSHNNILFPAVVAMVALNAMPIMSVSCVDGEACELMIRGYNLMEFSPWGAIPIFTTVFVLAILFSCQRKAAKQAELLLLLAANCVCYVTSVMAARAWLESVSSSFIFTHFGMITFPLGTMALILSAIVYCEPGLKKVWNYRG